MFTLGILIGLYSYTIFLFGILHMLYGSNILIITTFFSLLLLVFAYMHRKSFQIPLMKTTFTLICVSLLLLQAAINYIGVLGPELGFDALWYHLTLPKLFLQNHSIFHVGGNLYYSDMPKLVEMLYIPALFFGSEVLAKNVHFFFGVLSCIALFFLGKKMIGRKAAILAVVIFYTNLVVGFESISAYIDLGRTFFEILSFFAFYRWVETRQKHFFILSAILVGITVTVKLLAVGSLFLYLFLLTSILLKKSTSGIKIIFSTCVFAFFALLVPTPWFLFSYLHTKNPFFPFFTNTYPTHFSLQLLNPFSSIISFLHILLFADDPLSPIYFLVLPLIIFYAKKIYTLQPLLFLYSLLASIIWYLTPQTGGGRFILPYLPVFSLLVAFTIERIVDQKLQKLLVGTIFVLSITSIFYRGTANAKYIPYLLGRETKASFLARHLNFHFGDFYDIDGYFAKIIKPTDNVLLEGFHNEYYVNFPFTDSSWQITGKKYSYIATQNGALPPHCFCWIEVYKNSTTGVILYKYRK